MTQTAEHYDAIVIGAGLAGGIVACILAERGKYVLLLERGKRYSVQKVSRDHLRNHRLQQYGINTGPALEGHPRTGENGRILHAADDAYQNNAMAVGGGTLVYGAQAWRFLPDDFRMASRYGVPAGSSLADWPISYADLAPFYARAEQEIGVCGVPHRLTAPRTEGYPMPPLPDTLPRQVLRRAAEKLGWDCGPVPLAINSVPYNGRAACTRCGECVGFSCLADAKNGSQNTALPRALATGRCQLITEAQVARILTDSRGRATGVEYFRESDATKHTATAKTVVVSAGAIESGRLLFLSADAHNPRGLGNHADFLGRNLQGHYYPQILGLFKEKVHDHLGPGVSISTCQFNHGNPGIIGGAMLADEFVKLPIVFWKRALPPGAPRWGLANKELMRQNYSHTLNVCGPVQEIPNPDARVTLDPHIRDKFGLPVIHFSGTGHPETVRTAEFMRARGEEWLHAAGAERIWTHPIGLYLSGGQHQAGTCRMSADPARGVTDPFGRVHGFENLFVCDGSLHVTNGGFNPALTIMALAFRNTEHIALQL